MNMLNRGFIAKQVQFVIFRGKNRIFGVLICALVVTAFPMGLFCPRPAASAPDKPSISGSTATFTGDQHLGIYSGINLMIPSDFYTSSIHSVIINNLSSNITPGFPYNAGLYMEYFGLNGKNGGDNFGGDGGDGHDGYNSGESVSTPAFPLTLDYQDIIFGIMPTVTTPMNGIFLNSQGGEGGAGGQGSSALFQSVHGGDGGKGQDGGALKVTNNGLVQTPYGRAIDVISTGGRGGNGGVAKSGFDNAYGGTAGAGGKGGTVSVDNYGIVISSGIGITAESAGGAGGTGEKANTAGKGTGGHGGTGGNGDTVIVNNYNKITTSDTSIYAVSKGGAGGNGGHGGGDKGVGGAGGTGGTGGQVTVTNTAEIKSRDTGHGIYALSQAGNGGLGGEGVGTGAIGGTGGQGGTGGTVSVTNEAKISVFNNQTQGILAQSLGGAGGDGGEGDGGFKSTGGAALGPGPGGQVKVVNSGIISTSGETSNGIFAQSVGGFAGSSGSSSGLVAYGASSESGGDGGIVEIDNTGPITINGKRSDALFAQSIGGGGGAGGSSTGMFTKGGDGSAGGKGGDVTVKHSGELNTLHDDSMGIFAQSVGGGGGDGGDAISVSTSFSVAMGGKAKKGGDSGHVTVTSDDNKNPIKIQTGGNNSAGVFAQSVGGGGGNGGYAVSASAGFILTSSVAMGGSADSGGNGGTVDVDLESNSIIHTMGDNAYGIFAESLGGGGGVGGYSVAAAASTGYSASVGIGGSGGNGGSGQKVNVKASSGDINTIGENAHGIFAQSVGGGGGAGGYSITGALGAGLTANVSIGGSGGAGGEGGEVDVNNKNTIATSGKMGVGLLAQSVGGGGGAGGYTIAGSISAVPVNVSLGGSGDTGGNGGLVNVINDAGIVTSGEKAYGILAQSVGGGGGAGGFSFSADAGIGAFAFSLGGSGTKGGLGGQVFLDNTGAIETHNIGSHGIIAQSVGGGGGAGGWAASGAMSIAFQVADISIPGGSVTVALGGKGGPGSDAQKASVHNSGSILTDKEGANGIVAQSVGGGGGDGGFATAASANFSEGKTGSAVFSVAVGGAGGDGGDGGQVEIINGGATHTTAKNSSGILAQSVGGGGGSGGLSAAINIVASSEKSASISAAVSVGGSGGSGGQASQVSVTSANSISTQGDSSYGINAQSIGGGGGNGGTSITGMMGLTKSDKNYQMQVSVGGSGKVGGAAGGVSVNSTGAVSTQGKQSVGILAQSVGGGGGNGGMSFDGQLTMNASKNFAVSVGGSGDGGGNGNSVTVTSSAPISTLGTDAHGILAQSIGGGGGTGGLGGSGILAFRDSEKKSVNLSVNVGGGGGGGGGGSVNVTNQSDITTAGENAFGIFAQSLGGGGGYAGGGFSGHINTEMPESGTAWEISTTIGGQGGSGKNGGSLQIDNQGTIKTTGDASHGIFAQSIGGGGGAGGDAKDFVIDISEPSFLPEMVSTLAIGVGGSGGGSSPGGKVIINNTGAITTDGEYSKGILAQSIGGGGGVGGSNIGSEYSKRSTVIPNTITISLGGEGAGSSNGGAVTVTNSAAITTSGEGSEAIFAQSVGAGGGIGGEGELGLLKPGIAVGGKAGAAGAGGAVTVTNSGAINTSGDGAHGIFAQSVGGGGGKAGDVARFETEFADIGLGLGFARSGGAGGDGGHVGVTNTADITTRGQSAYGIFAQSVGGGGGEAGEVGIGPGAVTNYLLGSVGDAGYGGLLSVSHTAGKITTLGDDSIGIFAQSAGGENTGGTVDITVGGDVLCLGENSNGILAQSIGLEGNGSISITVASGTVQGGSGGTGVVFMDGAYNTLINSGVVTTIDGIDGMAVESRIGDGGKGIAGKETINNYGTIIGSVDLGGGINSFHNYQNASFDSGQKINLGEGNLFTNDGTITPGGSAGSVSVLTGNFTQTSTGIFQTTLNGSGPCGRLQVLDTANLNGTLKLNYGSGPFVTGTTYEILTANTVQNTFSKQVFPDAPLLTLTTNYFPQSVKLTVNAQSFATVAQNSHEMLLGQYHDRMLLSADHDFMQALGRFQTLPAAKIRSAFASFSPGVYDANTFTTFRIERQFIRTVQKRLRNVRSKALSPALSPEMRLQASNEKPMLLAANDSDTNPGLNCSASGSRQKRFGISFEGFGHFGDADEAGGLSGFDYDMGGVALDVDYRVTEQMVIGAGFGYADTRIDLDNGFGAGDIDSFFGSVYGTYFLDRAYLEGVFTYGDHAYDNSRRISIGDIQGKAESDHDADAFSALIEGGYNFTAADWNLQPFAALFYSCLDEEGFRESGAGRLNMHIGGSQTDALASELGLRVSRSFMACKGILTPEFKAAWQYDYDVDKHAMPLSFAGAPLEITVDGREQSSSALLGAGVSYASHCGMTVSIHYNGEFGDEFKSHSVFGQIRVPF